MQTCSHCHIELPFNAFHKGGNTNGLSALCRTCSSEATKARARTIPGLIKRIYNNQRMTTKKMGRPAPTYTVEELLAWVEQQPHFPSLYANWVASSYEKFLIPSIDRKDNEISYTLDNIQLTTWRQNLDNQKSMNINGEYLHSDSKAVEQYTLEGEYVTTHGSIAIAMRAVTGKRTSVTNISNVCNEKWHSVYGFKWKWAEALS